MKIFLKIKAKNSYILFRCQTFKMIEVSGWVSNEKTTFQKQGNERSQISKDKVPSKPLSTALFLGMKWR